VAVDAKRHMVVVLDAHAFVPHRFLARRFARQLAEFMIWLHENGVGEQDQHSVHLGAADVGDVLERAHWRESVGGRHRAPMTCGQHQHRESSTGMPARARENEAYHVSVVGVPDPFTFPGYDAQAPFVHEKP
jgi:hypothetical protein